MNDTSPPHSPDSAADKAADSRIRVMVVDDSAVIRGLIIRGLEQDQNIEIITSLATADSAITTLKNEIIDVIVLDIEMPGTSGLDAIPALLAICPAVQIIMASTLTQQNAKISLDALTLGAVDYIPKPSARQELVRAEDFYRELLHKVQVLGEVAPQKGSRNPRGRTTTLPVSSPQLSLPTTPTIVPAKPSPSQKLNIIAIGSSTGGPQALIAFLKSLHNALKTADKILSVPIVITQHMPPTFTKILSEHLTRESGLKCHEAVDGETIQSGHVYIAPGDFHMLIQSKGGGSKPIIQLNQNPPINYCRPSVDPMLVSVADSYTKGVLAVILTGMGHDGLNGCTYVQKLGGTVIAQDEASSVVWGMPGAVAKAGLTEVLLPPDQLGALVAERIGRYA